MQAVYLWDENNYYVASREVDEGGELPGRSTFSAPPDLEGEQVATWTHEGWQILERRPQPPAVEPDWAVLIAARRYIAEISGTTIEGMPIDTGRDSQGLITGAAVQAIIDPEYSLRWKTTAGFVDLTGAQVLGVASAVRAYVQACFDRESALLDAVADVSITAEMLDEGWPA